MWTSMGTIFVLYLKRLITDFDVCSITCRNASCPFFWICSKLSAQASFFSLLLYINHIKRVGAGAQHNFSVPEPEQNTDWMTMSLDYIIRLQSYNKLSCFVHFARLQRGNLCRLQRVIVFCKTYYSATAYTDEKSWVDCVWNAVEKNNVVPT
jgi:hypothetical protein